MSETATGLVLRTRPLTETSLIVHWLTPTVGRLATVAKGARRANSPFRGKLDLFYSAEFSFVRSRRSELHNLREVNLRQTYSFLRRDLEALRQASFCAALIEQTTEMDTPVPAMYRLLVELLAQLEQSAQPQFVLGFQLKLLVELGLQPNWAETKLTPGARELARALEQMDWPLVARLKLTPAQNAELDRFLKAYYAYHVGRIPGGRASVQAVR